MHSDPMFLGKPTTKVETQAAPKKCDPNFSYDAATMIGNEIVFFKNRYNMCKTCFIFC